MKKETNTLYGMVYNSNGEILLENTEAGWSLPGVFQTTEFEKSRDAKKVLSSLVTELEEKTGSSLLKRSVVYPMIVLEETSTYVVYLKMINNILENEEFRYFSPKELSEISLAGGKDGDMFWLCLMALTMNNNLVYSQEAEKLLSEFHHSFSSY